MNIGRPKLNREPVHDHFPFVLRWKGKQNGPTANRDVIFYRKALDVLKPSDVSFICSLLCMHTCFDLYFFLVNFLRWSGYRMKTWTVDTYQNT